MSHTCKWDESIVPYEHGTMCEAGCDWQYLCDGNPHKCHSAYRRYIATMSERQRELYIKKTPFPNWLWNNS